MKREDTNNDIDSISIYCQFSLIKHSYPNTTYKSDDKAPLKIKYLNNIPNKQYFDPNFFIWNINTSIGMHYHLFTLDNKGLC